MGNKIAVKEVRAYTILLVSLAIIAMTSFMVYGILETPEQTTGTGSGESGIELAGSEGGTAQAITGNAMMFASWVSGN